MSENLKRAGLIFDVKLWFVVCLGGTLIKWSPAKFYFKLKTYIFESQTG